MAQPQSQNPGSESPNASNGDITMAAVYPHLSELTVETPRTEEDPAGHPLIPGIRHIGPSIFVPLTEDPSAPYTPMINRKAELRQILARLDEHTSAVRSNLFNILARDAARISQDARRQDAFLTAAKMHPGNTDSGLDPADMGAMINKMEEPCDPAQDYNLTEIPVPNFDRGILIQNPREWALNHLMRLIIRGTATLEGYEQAVEQTRQIYEQELKKEMEREPE